MYHIFIHLFADGHLGYFHVLLTVNSATMNIGVQLQFCLDICPGVALPDIWQL